MSRSKHKSSGDVAGTKKCQLFIVLLYFSRYCTVRLKMFIFCLFFMYYLCKKYYKPITVQYYIADCVYWVPRLTAGLTNALSEQNSFVCSGLTVIISWSS